MFRVILTAAATVLACAPQALAAQVSVSRVKPVEIDYANAAPMPLPSPKASPGSLLDLMTAAEKGSQRLDKVKAEEPILVQGGKGDGERVPDKVPTSRFLADDTPVPQEFGTNGHPFTTATERDASAELHARAGKIFFKIGKGSYVCSGALIKPGVVATAAHCVADFGKEFHTGIEFVPGYQKGAAPFGRYKADYALALTSYLDGTGACTVRGVVCQDDVALIVLKPLKGKFPGQRTGWFGYAANGAGFNGSRQAMITQLGYPVALDGGQMQERTDSQGVVDGANSNNTVIGSLQTGGSSGGPWLINFGFKPKLSGISFGAYPARNIVVGTTSWGYTNSVVKQQGASPFTSANIIALVGAACSKSPKAC